MKKFIPLLSLLLIGLFIAGATVKEHFPKKRLCLITGCARSGTQFVQEVLRKNNLPVRHEREVSKPFLAYFKDALGLESPENRNKNNIIVSWAMAADSDRAAWGPPSNSYEFKHVFHQVRDPLKTINSAANEPEESWQFVRQFVPEIKDEDSNLVRSAKYWYYWNLLAEKKAEWTYRVEDIDLKIGEMSERLGVPLTHEAIEKVPHNQNTRHHQNSYTWDDLKAELSPELYDNIVSMAKRYGY